MAAPPLPMRPVNINVDEGTWMDVDVSPDGKTIAFDLLGDIYTMPIAGGTPTRIAEGLPFEMQPQFSPDGKRIAFTSDRGGGDNIWVMNVDGSDKRPADQGTVPPAERAKPGARTGASSRRASTSRPRARSAPARSGSTTVGGGDGFVAVKRASETLQKELGEPVYCAGRQVSIFYTRNVSPGTDLRVRAGFQYGASSRSRATTSRPAKSEQS